MRPISEKKALAMKSCDQRSKPIKDKSAYKFGRKPRAPLARMSKKMKRQKADYYPVNNAFLRKPENRWCYVCLCRSANLTVSELRTVMEMDHEEGDRLLSLAGGILTQSTEVHHYRGRIGRLLSFEPFFLASCFGCRQWPHTFFRQARELELLAPATIYDTFPSDAELEMMPKKKKLFFEKTKIVA